MTLVGAMGEEPRLHTGAPVGIQELHVSFLSVSARGSMLTIAGPSSHELVVKRSRFVATAVPVGSREEVEAFLASSRDDLATHNAHAFVVGAISGMSDDGEVRGTAGRPILALLEGRRLVNLAVLVTRYYGGTKLGTGGLVRAYSAAAAGCLDGAEVITVVQTVALVVRAPFDASGQVHVTLDRLGQPITEEMYTSRGIELSLSVVADDVARLEEALGDATRGRARVERLPGCHRR